MDYNDKDLVKYVQNIPSDATRVNKPSFDIFDIYTPEVQPFIKDLSKENREKFLSLLNQNVGNYIYMNNLITMTTEAKKHLRGERSSSKLEKQIDTSLSKLESLTESLPYHEAIKSKIDELNSLIEESISCLVQPMSIKRPTKKDDIEPRLRADLKLFSIKAVDHQITKLLFTIPTYS